MTSNFPKLFEQLTDNPPFPWQAALYSRFIGLSLGGIPSSCNLPTGLGKTSVVAVWLLALAERPDLMPRRLVYVVNRRTVVDQTTEEVRKYRDALDAKPDLKIIRETLTNLCSMPLASNSSRPTSPLALSTLRGQFANNREWSTDPARPAVIVGTVDMIGSRLLFSGYGVGFKGKPLHAGFLGQDVLLVHDEAHLEPAFQDLLETVVKEQSRCNEFVSFRLMELSATSRGQTEAFGLTDEDRSNNEVIKRINAKKQLTLHKIEDEKKLLADKIAVLAKGEFTKNRAVLIFVRKVDDVEKVVKLMPKGSVQQLTGTLRGFERDQLVEDPIFKRFLPNATAEDKTVYLVCTSAGEVGVNISADHLVCDLSTFESMAQRFGRVNRFGLRVDTQIHVVHPTVFSDNDFDRRRAKTLSILNDISGDGSPESLGNVPFEQRLAAFSPKPTILPATDILFDAWALTTIKGKLPGRPTVEPYLHGVSEWEPPETHVAWRQEVGVITGDLLSKYTPEDLLQDYPIKPHELLRDNANRVFDKLKKLKADTETPVWLIATDDSAKVTTLKKLIDAGKEELNYMTVLLPPSAGGLESGFLTSNSTSANDVADEFLDDRGRQTRIRLPGNDSRLDDTKKTMRLIRSVDLTPASTESDGNSTDENLWLWYELPSAGDGDGSKASKLPVSWQDHTDDVTTNAMRIVKALPLADELKDAIVLAAKFHDLGKKRTLWQRSIGNPTPANWLAKSGGNMKPRELGETYRHEFGSLIDALDPKQPHISELNALSEDMREVVLHLIAAHHGFGRPHFPSDYVFDPEPKGANVEQQATEIPRRFGRLQRKFGRWGLAYLESILRAADYAASANPTKFMEDAQ